MRCCFAPAAGTLTTPDLTTAPAVEPGAAPVDAVLEPARASKPEVPVRGRGAAWPYPAVRQRGTLLLLLVDR